MQDEIQWNQIVEVPTSSLISFTERPFRVVTDYQMLNIAQAEHTNRSTAWSRVDSDTDR